MERMQDENIYLYKRTFKIGIILALGMVIAYKTTTYLMIPIMVIGCIYILATKDDDQSTAMLLFLFFFSSIFKIASGTTSLFFVCKIAYIFRAVAKGYFRRVNRIYIHCFAFVMYCILNMMYAGTSATIRIINLFLWFTVAYLMLFHMINDKYKMCLFFIVTFFYSCIIAGLAVFVPRMANEIKNALVYYDTGYGADISRYTGMFGDPNMATVIIIICMFFCLYLYKNQKLNSLLFVSFCVVLTLLGIATGSKSCFLLLIVFWCIYFMTNVNNRRIKTLLILCAGVILFTFSSTSLYDFYMYRFFGAASGVTTGRTDIWKMYIDSLNSGGIKNWIWGYGINTANLPNGRAAHNVFIQVVYNIGIVGLFFYIISWIQIIRGYNSMAYVADSSRIQKVLSYAPMICILSTAVFLDAFFLEAYYIAFPLAVLITSPQEVAEGEQNEKNINDCYTIL